MATSVKTGLPELPEGQFWRVEHPIDNDRMKPDTYYVGNAYPRDKAKLQVALMEIREYTTIRVVGRLWWTKRVDGTGTTERSVDSEVAEGVEANHILAAAEKLLARRSLLGDYPPKSLAVVPSD